MTEENHVGLARLHFEFVRRGLLKINVPYVNLVQVGVRGDDAAVPGPALEAIDFAGVNQNLADLQPRLQALKTVRGGGTISFEGHPTVGKSSSCTRSRALGEHESLLGNVDFCDNEERGLASCPLLILGPVVYAALVGPRAKVYLLPQTLCVVFYLNHFSTFSFVGSSGN